MLCRRNRMVGLFLSENDEKRICGTDGNKDKTVYTLESLNQLMMTMA